MDTGITQILPNSFRYLILQWLLVVNYAEVDQILIIQWWHKKYWWFWNTSFWILLSMYRMRNIHTGITQILTRFIQIFHFTLVTSKLCSRGPNINYSVVTQKLLVILEYFFMNTLVHVQDEEYGQWNHTNTDQIHSDISFYSSFY